MARLACPQDCGRTFRTTNGLAWHLANTEPCRTIVEATTGEAEYRHWQHKGIRHPAPRAPLPTDPMERMRALDQRAARLAHLPHHGGQAGRARA